MEIAKPDYALHARLFDASAEPYAELPLSRDTLLFYVIMNDFYKRLHSLKMSLFITMDGVHRSGKSVFAYFMAKLLDPTFEENPKARYVKNPEQMLRLIREIKERKIKGAVILVDEAGASLNSAEWYDEMMRALVKTFTVIGYLNPCILFIAPVKDMFISSARKMSHYHMRFDRTSSMSSRADIYKVIYSSLRQKYFHKHPIIHMFHMKTKLCGIRIGKPPKWLLDEYAALEQENKPVLLDEIENDALAAKGRREAKEQRRQKYDVEQIADDVLANMEKYESKRSRQGKHGFMLSSALIMVRKKLPAEIARAVKEIAEGKYYELRKDKR